MQTKGFDKQTRQQAWWAVIFLMVLTYFTYVHNFWNPPALFWDENYHIASAQKYLNGIFFMEPHPPLGKMLVALGEKLVNMNEIDNQFIGTDYAQNPPAGFSFLGYRLFPVLLAWFTTSVIFLIFLYITRNVLWSTLLSFLYAFDNALIVHFRSAMLDSTMFFFSALTILAFLLLIEWKDRQTAFSWAAILFGLGFASVVTTKAFGLIFILLIPFLWWMLRDTPRAFFRFLSVSILAFIVVFVGIWQLHFSIAERVNPALPDAGYYQASDQYKEIINNQQNNSFLGFPIMLRDSLGFVGHYERGVPRLNLCKADENGSPWFLWPFGARSINYRWETPDGQMYSYLYLQVNPVVWFLGLMGVILTFVFLSASHLLPVQERPKHLTLLTTFFTLYVCYMIAISRIDRVMYLYHYFLPLLFSFILFGLLVSELKQFGRFKLSNDRKTVLLLVCGCFIFIAYQFFRPLSYYEQISDSSFKRRSVLRMWELKCVRCPQDSPMVIPSQ